VKDSNLRSFRDGSTVHRLQDRDQRKRLTRNNFRAYSPQIADDHRLQPDTPMGNVYDYDGRVLYLNGFHDNAPGYARCIVKPKAVFSTHTSLTTEHLVGLSRCRTTKVFGTVSWVETEHNSAGPTTGVLH
jgi:hypothetical protein